VSSPREVNGKLSVITGPKFATNFFQLRGNASYQSIEEAEQEHRAIRTPQPGTTRNIGINE